MGGDGVVPVQQQYPTQHYLTQPQYPTPAVQITQPVAIVQAPPAPPDFMVLACVVFWCVNWPLGLIAFIFSSGSQSALRAGDYETARKKGQTSKIFSMCGIICTGVLVAIFSIIFIVNSSFY